MRKSDILKNCFNLVFNKFPNNFYCLEIKGKYVLYEFILFDRFYDNIMFWND